MRPFGAPVTIARGESVRSLSNVMVEFTTPANTKGLGTGGYLEPSQDPITGIAALDSSNLESPNLAIVSVRLKPNANQMKTALLRLNRECIEKSRLCLD
jgi:hypothetical protein